MLVLIIKMTINREKREAAAVMGSTMRLVACVDSVVKITVQKQLQASSQRPVQNA
jgi:hypothetical protein